MWCITTFLIRLYKNFMKKWSKKKFSSHFRGLRFGEKSQKHWIFKFSNIKLVFIYVEYYAFPFFYDHDHPPIVEDDELWGHCFIGDHVLVEHLKGSRDGLSWKRHDTQDFKTAIEQILDIAPVGEWDLTVRNPMYKLNRDCKTAIIQATARL